HPEVALLEFSLGTEVKDGILHLQELLARLPAPTVPYGIAPLEGNPGAGWLVPPEALREAEEGWDEVFFGSESELEGDEDDEDDDLGPWDEDGDPWDEDDWGGKPEAWDEDDAPRWLAFLVDEPAALDSLAVLDDLARAISELGLDRYPFLDRPLLQPIL